MASSPKSESTIKWGDPSGAPPADTELAALEAEAAKRKAEAAAAEKRLRDLRDRERLAHEDELRKEEKKLESKLTEATSLESFEPLLAADIDLRVKLAGNFKAIRAQIDVANQTIDELVRVRRQLDPNCRESGQDLSLRFTRRLPQRLAAEIEQRLPPTLQNPDAPRDTTAGPAAEWALHLNR